MEEEPHEDGKRTMHTISTEVFGDGIDMRLRSQGRILKSLYKREVRWEGLNAHLRAFSPIIIIEDHIYRLLFTHSIPDCLSFIGLNNLK